MSNVHVEVSPDAAEFVRDRGGALYIWVDDAGLGHDSMEAPSTPSNWTRSKVGGVEVSNDASAGDST